MSSKHVGNILISGAQTVPEPCESGLLHSELLNHTLNQRACARVTTYEGISAKARAIKKRPTLYSDVVCKSGQKKAHAVNELGSKPHCGHSSILISSTLTDTFRGKTGRAHKYGRSARSSQYFSFWCSVTGAQTAAFPVLKRDFSCDFECVLLTRPPCRCLKSHSAPVRNC